MQIKVSLESILSINWDKIILPKAGIYVFEILQIDYQMQLFLETITLHRYLRLIEDTVGFKGF